MKVVVKYEFLAQKPTKKELAKEIQRQKDAASKTNNKNKSNKPAKRGK